MHCTSDAQDTHSQVQRTPKYVECNAPAAFPQIVYNMVMLTDTHPKMEALQIELLRQTPPWRKAEMLDHTLPSSLPWWVCATVTPKPPKPNYDAAWLTYYLAPNLQNVFMGRWAI